MRNNLIVLDQNGHKNFLDSFRKTSKNNSKLLQPQTSFFLVDNIANYLDAPRGLRSGNFLKTIERIEDH